MWIFKKPLPPPEPIYKRQPLATLAVILTLVSIFVLGPVGIIFNGMSDELKQKVDNQTLQLMLQNQQILIEQNKKEAEKKREDDTKKFEELQRTQRQTLQTIQNLQNQIQAAPVQKQVPQVTITKEIFEYYISLPPDKKIEFKKLHPSYQVLPDP